MLVSEATPALRRLAGSGSSSTGGTQENFGSAPLSPRSANGSTPNPNQPEVSLGREGSSSSTMRATATAREIENQRLHLNDVVFTKDSETPEEIAEPALIAEEIESLICGYHLAIARPKPGIAHGPFIAQAMADPEIRWQFRRLSNGVVRFGLTLEAIESVEIFLPNIWTQERIAGVLEAEDAAIDSLTRSVKLLRDQKRGVSQKLLHSGSPLNAAIWPTNNGHRKSAKVNKR